MGIYTHSSVRTHRARSACSPGKSFTNRGGSLITKTIIKVLPIGEEVNNQNNNKGLTNRGGS